MHTNRTIPLRLSFLLAACGVVAGLSATACAGTVTIYRDTYGVPYIYGETDADAAYGLGYAQAEDRLADLFVNVRMATGTMAEVFGKEHVEMDYIMRLVRNAEQSEAYWKTAPAAIRESGDSFVRGVKAYMAEHPEKVPPFATDLYGWHALAIMRTMILNWPLGTIQDEVRREPNTLGWGSNEWAVAPSRSAAGCAILLTDPHLTWEGMAVFYEAHVYGKDLSEQHGYFLVGTFGMAYGHTEFIGWAPTTGGPDTADVYVMKLNPDNPLQYEYDGEWRDAVLGSISIPVKDAAPQVMPTYTTHLGPAFAEPDLAKHTILVGATPYIEDMGLLEQGYAMLRAKNADELYEAIGMNHFMEQNFMYADRNGTIGYVRSGQAPIRPDGYDWSRPVPGNTSKTKWLGIHPVADLVQIKNPPQGYMQNCNISPEFMMENSPLTPDKYPAYLYNVSWDSRNSRGDRALAALAADDSITKEEAMALAFDVTDPYLDGWQQVLKDAVEAMGRNKMKEPEFADCVKRLLDWDGMYIRESHAAPLMRYWRLEAFEKFDPAAVNAGRRLSVDQQMELLATLERAMARMKAIYGSTDIAWGDMIKVGRGGKYFPCCGGDYGGGENEKRMRTLLSVGVSEQEKGTGVFIARKGSMAMALMFCHKDGIESYTCTPWGQSADPESPHYMDQGEHLYSQRKFKPVYRSKKELLEHVSSEKTLTAPNPGDA